jgi:hypothetical protein
MRKQLLPVLGLGMALFLTAFTTLQRDHSISKAAPKSCMIAATFTNQSTTYTIPLAAIDDGVTSDTETSIAPGNFVDLTLNYNGTSLEFNVGFTGTHPAGRVKIFDQNGVELSCVLVPANATTITAQFYSNVFCGDHYYFYWQEKFAC